MKIAVLTCGMLPIPAVRGGAVENLIDFYLEFNDSHKLHDITIYSPWDVEIKKQSALTSLVNHYVFIDVSSFKARIARRIYGYIHHYEYYNYFIEYYFEKVYDKIKKKNFDLIILENCPGYAYKLSQRGYNNIILHLHNDLLNTKSRFHDVIFNSLKKILTVSDFIKERVSIIQSNNKIQTIYNGIDIKKFSRIEISQVSRNTIGFNENDFVIAYNGRINPEKGISELIDAILLLKEKSNLKLMIIGSSFFDNASNEDPFVLSLKEKTKTIKGNTIFTGFIPYDIVPQYLHLANIAVLPSMWDEPFGLTIVEALAAGLPLITTRSGGIPEICEEVATIVDRNNIVNNLASAILDLYEHPEKCKQMSTASLERAKQFDKEAYVKNFFAAIERIT